MLRALTLSCLALVLLMGTSADNQPPRVPNTPAAVADLVYARAFTLEEGYPFEWRKEKPILKEGYILVLKVNPDFVYPRQCLEPVLYVGNQTAERINIGYMSEHVIAIVPGTFDLKNAPIWFGTPELPERVDTTKINIERQLANEAKIKAFDLSKVNRAKSLGGETLKLIDRDDLRRSLIPLIRQYAPDEEPLAKSLERIPDPKTKATPRK